MASLSNPWQRPTLDGSLVLSADGERLGNLVGFYEDTELDEYHFVVERNRCSNNKYVAYGIPVERTTFESGNQIKAFGKKVDEYPATYLLVPPSVEVMPIPPWTQKQLTKEELEVLRSRMKMISKEDFSRLISQQ